MSPPPHPLKEHLKTNLSIEVVSQAVKKLTFNGILLSKQGQVMAELFMGGNDGAFAILVKLWPSCTTKDLHHVQDAEIHQGTTLGIVNLCPLKPQETGTNTTQNI